MRLTILIVCLAVPPIHADPMRAGAAAVDITPPTGYAMWGYAARHDAPSTGVMAPLKARALVLAAGGKKIALVGLDLGRAPTRDSTARIRERLKKIGIDEVFLVASHTHHGPVLELDNWPNAKESYVGRLENRLVSVITEADRLSVPARVGVARKATKWNRNRHSKRDDKQVDDELLVLRAETLGGEAIAHVVNFAAHPTMLPTADLRFSPDYVGHLCDAVETETRVPCVFLQGAAGDLSPNPPGERGPEAFGKAVGAGVLELIKEIKCVESKSPSLGTAREAFRFKARADVTNPFVRLAMERAFFPELIAAYEREYREGVRPELTVALLNDEFGFVGASGEFFCGHSLSLKKRARLPFVFFLGYCNDYHQYFPTIEGSAEGGYGAVPPINMAEVGAGEKIIDRALLQLYQLRGLLGD